MSDIYFTSALDSSYRSSLERLLFYNPNQSRTLAEAMVLIERYGEPRIVADGANLRIACGVCQPQTLYAIENSDQSRPLVGVVVFSREAERLVVLHVAVREDRVKKREASGRPVLLEMIDAVCGVGRKIKGIASVVMFPGTAKELRLPVK